MYFQIGLLTGISLAAILGLSFSSLATLFTKDAAVLEIVSTGVLVCIQIYGKATSLFRSLGGDW